MFLRGWNPGPGGNDPNRGFGTPQLDDFKSHNHPVSDPGHIHNVTAYAGDLVGNQYTLATTNASVVLTNPLMTIQRSKTNVSTRVVGGTETRPVNVALLPCICAAPTPGVLVENAALPNTLGAVYGIGADTENAVFGHGAGANLITGEASNNVIVGAGAGLGVVDGGGNIAIGAETLGTAGSHADNIAIGALSLNLLEGDSSSQSNIAIGAGAFSNLVTGANNIGLGARAGNFWESGEGNLILGSYTGAAETTAPNNTIVIASGGDATSKLIINEDGALSFSDVYTGASYGAAGQVLQSNGPGARPTWVNAGGFQTYPVSYESNVTTVTSGTYGSTVVRYNLPMVTNPVAPMDATTGKFQPTVAGMWCIQATARCYDDANQESNVSMAKNGNNTIGACGSIGQVFGSVSATVYLNGTTDFVQIIVTTQTGASNSQGGAYFSAFYVGN
jgi:hypothetical protein